ncbi:MAG: DEAD/DEAH box helicase [Bryobacteraceae bacterium]
MSTAKSLNPITYTENVVEDFLRYQLTTYTFADPSLHRQMRQLLSLDQTRRTPLLAGPFISLSRSFRKGPSLRQLGQEGVLHPLIANVAGHEFLYGHQEKAIRAIAAGRTTLVSTGTGSGKTECFLYPIISKALALRDAGEPESICAVIIYPMNALAEDQLGRLRELLCGVGVTFGLYVGKTPEHASDVTGPRLPAGASRADYTAKVNELRAQGQPGAVHPPEERVSREEMRAAGKAPRILLTNVKQLELLLTRQQDIEMFSGARLDFLVVDEAHTFSGANGAETACLLRRLRSFCGKSPEETVCIATSATIADRSNPLPALHFASRFFGVAENSVEVVNEDYEPDQWAAKRTASPALPGNQVLQLRNVLEAIGNVDSDPPASLRLLKATFQSLTGQALDINRWQDSLYERLASNEVAYQIADALTKPRAMADLMEDLAKRLGRAVPEEEVLIWLALGAASQRDSRSLLRPVVHAFVRGVAGGVVTFPPTAANPRLALAADEVGPSEEGLFRLPLMTCTTCGQHYFTHHVRDFSFTDRAPGGGEAVENRVIWRPLEEQLGGDRVVLLDRLVVDAVDDDDDDDLQQPRGPQLRSLPRNSVPLHLCRICGTLHAPPVAQCDGCGKPGPLVDLFVVRQSQDYPGRLVSCVGCSAIGRLQNGRYREPARPVKASPVSDVHVLAQSMIHRAERKRLLVFSDNRQDAAFQAGWMQDHARRYRLRALMYAHLSGQPLQVQTLVSRLDDELDQDNDLSQALLPEVWNVARKAADLQGHAAERRKFLRILVLREVATGARQRIGLEPWGRLLVDYDGLTPDQPFFSQWGNRLGLSAEELLDGVAAVLDFTRRSRILLDRDGQIFSRIWQEGDREIANGYLPLFRGGPKGLKLQRDPGDVAGRISQWIGTRPTSMMQVAQKWGVHPNDVPVFLHELWELVADQLRLIVPATLTGFRARALPGATGARQIDADRLLLRASRGLWRCQSCRRAHLRPTPRLTCLAWRCAGTLMQEIEDSDNYDLMVLDGRFDMVRPKEHSAQIPAADREELERLFKGESERVNTLVCTPTLELGVDIGALDSVLMRNVPPLPSNYWQRAGRAGRRHRMAVILTYARAHSHDRPYFNDPLKLLGGEIAPPSFNLRNDVMVRKHVHAVVLTAMHRLARAESSVGAADQLELTEVMRRVFPPRVREYLFDNAGQVRARLMDVTPLTNVLSKHLGLIEQAAIDSFRQGWPQEDSRVIEPGSLRRYITEMPQQLRDVLERLKRRLEWAIEQMDRLDDVRRRQGTLDPEQDALRNRCDRYVKRLKGNDTRKRREAEGFDDTNTYGVLAAESFLPGYGLDSGWVVGTYEAPKHNMSFRDWELRRNPALALREYIPGNLIYANGHRFIPRYYRLEPGEPVRFLVDVSNEAVAEVVGSTTAGLGAQTIPAVPICDVNLPHNSQISDDEDYRFQLSVAVYGYEQPQHGGGKQYRWGDRVISHRTGVRLRLVNVGASSLARNAGRLGYPVCLVCGQSRSPLASQADLQTFENDHRLRCGRPVEPIGFYADIVADAISLESAVDREEAYSVMEALRMGASEVLDMEIEDLQLLAVAQAGGRGLSLLLYDPMPGGSGLLDQMIARWPEVILAARRLVEDCPAQCRSACVDCLLHFRNSYYHRHLNRQTAWDRLSAWQGALVFTHDIPSRLPTTAAEEVPVNDPELTLRAMLERAGLQGYQPQHPIDLGRPLGATVPDFFYESRNTDIYAGLCIYLDGMGKHLHGRPETRERDREIREELRNQAYEVVEIQFGQLTDPEAMQQHFFKIGRFLLGRDAAQRLKSDRAWFGTPSESPGASPSSDAWPEILGLLDSQWHPLAQGLRLAGVRPPDEVDWDWMEDGRVSGKRAVMMWNGLAGIVVVVDSASGIQLSERVVTAQPSTVPAAVAALLRPYLEVAS